MGRAVIIMFVAMTLIPASDLCGKFLTNNHNTSPQFVAWSRFVIGSAVLLPFMGRAAWPLLIDWRIWLRGALIASGVSCIQMALTTEPLANVFAAFFIAPILSYLVSIRFLGETVTPLRSVLVLVGFAGVFLVVKPGFGGTPGLLWAVLAGCFYSLVLVTARWLKGYARAYESICGQFFAAGVITLPLGIAAVPEVTTPVVVLTLGNALGSTLGNALLLVAYSYAPATRMAPLVYFQLVAATGLGWIAFRDIPDGLTWIGIAVILTAGLASAALRR